MQKTSAEKHLIRMLGCNSILISIPGCPQVHTTMAVSEDTGNPEWNETYDFEIAEEELQFRYLLLHVEEEGRHSELSTLGQVILELDCLEPQAPHRQPLKLADMRNCPRLRSRPQQHRIAQEFREAFRAHAAARQPSFLFQQAAQGKKKVTVSCRKAGAQGSIQLVDGIPVF